MKRMRTLIGFVAKVKQFGPYGAIAMLLVVVLAKEALANEAPSITFSAIPLSGPNNVWKFYGTVDDEYVEGCTVTIGGLIDDVSVAVSSDGTYSYTQSLTPGDSGWATAQAIDQSGLKSELAQSFVSS